MPEDYVKKVHLLDCGCFEVEKMRDVFINQEGEAKAQIKWYGFKETTNENVDDVLVGAHLSLKKFLEKKNLDKIVKIKCLNEIKKHENE